MLPGVSVADARARLADAAKKPALLTEAKENIRRRGGAHSIAIASTRDKVLNGKRLDDIAGVCNATRNVIGLMPHPERAMEPLHGSTDGLVLFQSLLATARA